MGDSTVIHLEEGTGYCPRCQKEGKRFRLVPRLKTNTTGKNIPLFCKHCKTEYIVDIIEPSIARIKAEKTTCCQVGTK